MPQSPVPAGKYDFVQFTAIRRCWFRKNRRYCAAAGRTLPPPLASDPIGRGRLRDPAVLLPQKGRSHARAHRHSSPSSSSPPARNLLLAALSQADRDRLQPHLEPVEPRAPQAARAAQQAHRQRLLPRRRHRLRGRRAGEGNQGRDRADRARGHDRPGDRARQSPLAAFDLHSGRRPRAAHRRRRAAQGARRQRDPAGLAAEVRAGLHGADRAHRRRQCPRPAGAAAGALDPDGARPASTATACR